MDAPPLHETARSRARTDGRKALHTAKFWTAEVFFVSVITAVASLFSDDLSRWATGQDANAAAKVLIPTIGGFLTLLAIVSGAFLISLVLAPIRQRTEARSDAQALRERLKPSIKLMVDGHPASFQPEIADGRPAHRVRVGMLNSGSETVRDVGFTQKVWNLVKGGVPSC